MAHIVSARWYVIASAGLAALTGAGCGKTTEPPVPQSITVTPSSLSFSSKGATQQLTATVKDQSGNTIQNATVTWSSNNTAVATVTSGGLAASVGNGTTQIVAAAGGVSTTATVTVLQVGAAMTKTGGDNQSATVGTQLLQALAVQVSDALGNPVPGVAVSFSVTSGGGSVTPLSVLTDASGNASAQWTIGTSTTALQRVTASSGSGSAVFNATAMAGPPQSVVKQAGDNQKVGTGTAVAIKPAVLVKDQYGNPVANVTVTFAAGQNSGSVTPPVTPQTLVTGVATVGGWTVDVNPGTDTLDAIVTVSGLPDTVRFLATVKTPGPPASVAVRAGDGQTGLIGYALNFAPAVLVLDTAGIPVANAQVTFTVATGGGSVTGATQATATNGVATVGSWTVGSSPGPNTLTAAVSGSGIANNPITFNATGVAPTYNIDVRYLTTVTGARKVAFDSAVAFWQRTIYEDVPDINATGSNQIPAGTCGSNSPAINEVIDDLIIFVTLDSIDGPGKILGQSAPCYIRSTSKRPVVGLMHFDTADVQSLQNSGLLSLVIRHEMGHVVGFGTIWSCDQYGLCLLAGPASQGGTDPHFVGPQALSAFDGLGGTSYTGGAKVPVENCVGQPSSCGAGSIDSHWRESVFGNELMTSFINTGANPLSVLTIASMGDEGYTVNYAAADPYTHAFSLLAAPAPTGTTVHLENDILNLPIYMVDASGRVTGVWRR